MIPSTLLVVLSFFLIRAIQKANRRKERLLNQNRRSEANRQRESNSTTIMLFAIVVIFLIVNLPQGMILFVFIVYNSFEGIDMNMEAVYYAVHIDNMLILVSYPLNFTIYCCMSAQFRQTFKRIFCCSRAPLPSRSYSTATTPSAYVQLNGADNSMQNFNFTLHQSMLELKGSKATSNEELDLLI